MTDLAMIDAELLRRDVYPAEVLLPSGQLLRNVRAYVTTERLAVWAAGADRTLRQVVDLLLEEPGSVEGSRNSLSLSARLSVATEEGVAYINRASGCGCGSPLKALPEDLVAPWTHR